MLRNLWEKELDAELIATFLFIMLSFLYVEWKYGFQKVLDTLLLWMFPASVMVFLTLLVAKLIEKWHSRRTGRRKYLDWSSRV